MKPIRYLCGCLVALAVLVAMLLPAAAQANFGLKTVSIKATNSDGSLDFQAGSHPYTYTVAFGLNTLPAEVEGSFVDGTLRNLVLELPPGLVGNPQAVGLCKGIRFESAATTCPNDSQIGVAHVTFAGGLISTSGVFSISPAKGAPASLGFSAIGLNSFQEAALRSGSDYGLNVSDITIPNVGIEGIEEVIWGVPGDPSHDAERECRGGGGAGCSVEGPLAPFLTLPTACNGPLHTTVTVGSLNEPDNPQSATEVTLDGSGEPTGLDGCNALEFKPTISSQATTNLADSPSGLDFTIHQPQNEAPDGLAPAALKDVKVALPAGMTLNPSAANGLSACSFEEIGYQPSGGKIHFSESPQSCPDAAKLGTVEVNTPLLEEKVPGAIYLAKPFENPFGNLTSIYLAIESPDRGIIAKLAGKVEADPTTGQLTASFTENPQLPIEDIETHFFNGARAALTSPLTCGTHTTTSTLTPWSTPEGLDAHPTGSFETSLAASGTGACPTSEAQAPAAVAFSAGTTSPLSGAYSPFSLRIARADGTQHITAIDTTLPQGLVGKLAGIPYCPEAGIAQAIAREAPERGKEEQASPSCPQASEVGTVQVTAGSGITPIPVSGHAYLAGPYKGAPLSLAVIVPAVAGPFDLGTVVNRVALNVDPTTAQIHAVSDPLPTIREGIPLDVRSIEIKLDRPGFTLNPTSCEAKAIEGSVMTRAGQTAALNNRFQVGECGRLAFKPKLKLSLRGSTQRGKNPALKAVLTQPADQANIHKVSVVLPKSEFIDNRHISTPCTRVQFNAGLGNGAQCPAQSILGYATAYTPLLDKPLHGPVYFRSNGGERQLPDLVASLGGQVHLNVVGFIDSVLKKGAEVSRTRNTFAMVPDAPVSKFVLSLKGGKKGLLQNSANLCKVKNVAQVKFTGQNGKLAELSPTLTNSCKGKGGKSKAKKKSKGKK